MIKSLGIKRFYELHTALLCLSVVRILGSHQRPTASHWSSQQRGAGRRFLIGGFWWTRASTSEIAATNGIFFPLLQLLILNILFIFRCLTKLVLTIQLNKIELNRVEYDIIILIAKLYTHVSQNRDRIWVLIKLPNGIVNNDNYVTLQGEVMFVSLHITKPHVNHIFCIWQSAFWM